MLDKARSALGYCCGMGAFEQYPLQPENDLVFSCDSERFTRDAQKSLPHGSLGLVIHETLGTWTTGRSLRRRILMEWSGPGPIFYGPSVIVGINPAEDRP